MPGIIVTMLIKLLEDVTNNWIEEKKQLKMVTCDISINLFTAILLYVFDIQKKWANKQT